MVIVMVVNTHLSLEVHSVRNALIIMTAFAHRHYRVGVVCANDNTQSILHFMVNNSVFSAYGKEYVFDELVYYFENYYHILPKMCTWGDDDNFFITEYQQ